jgi:hypothetical protein
MKKIVDSFFLYQMGWIKPKKPFHTTVPLRQIPNLTSRMKSQASLKAYTPTYLEHGILGHGFRQIPPLP